MELLAQSGGMWITFGHWILGGSLLLISVFMVLLILVQRGRGGGLAGALGGAGGQSAFGTKAGDTFTKVTSYAAMFWILLCMLTIKLLGSGPPPKADPDADSEIGATDTTEGETDGETPPIDNAEPTDEAEADGDSALSADDGDS